MTRTMRRVESAKYPDQIATARFARALAVGDVLLGLYDVTSLYFEAEKEDALRKVGFSKERRVDPQIVVRLLVDRTGSPSRSVATRATRPRPRLSSRSSSSSNGADLKLLDGWLSRGPVQLNRPGSRTPRRPRRRAGR